MSNPLKNIYLKRGGKIEKDFPSSSLVPAIQKGDLTADDQISHDGENWFNLGKHKQLEKYFHITEPINIEPQTKKRGPRRIKILIVEDEAPLYKILNHNLQKEGYETVWAKNGEEALRFVKSEDPDLVITDIMIPYINGLQVLERVKKDPQTSDIPFIILSSKALNQDIVTGLELGGDDYITKPFNPDEIALRIKMILKRNKSERNL
jgi:CheY-like chemotaxis protein